MTEMAMNVGRPYGQPKQVNDASRYDLRTKEETRESSHF